MEFISVWGKPTVEKETQWKSDKLRGMHHWLHSCPNHTENAFRRIPEKEMSAETERNFAYTDLYTGGAGSCPLEVRSRKYKILTEFATPT